MGNVVPVGNADIVGISVSSVDGPVGGSVADEVGAPVETLGDVVKRSPFVGIVVGSRAGAIGTVVGMSFDSVGSEVRPALG